MGYNFPLYLHSKETFSDGIILYPPKVTSFAFDFVNGELLIELKVALDYNYDTAICSPVDLK